MIEGWKKLDNVEDNDISLAFFDPNRLLLVIK